MYDNCNTKFDINIHCDKCFYNPQCHSFHKLNENEKEIYYYTCPSLAKNYNDADGIYRHMCLEIKKIHKPWIWVFDCYDYGLKHLICYKVGLKLIQLLNSDLSNKLIQIIIINETFMFKLGFKYIWIKLPEQIKDIIIFDTNKSFSQLLKIDEKLSILEYNIIE